MLLPTLIEHKPTEKTDRRPLKLSILIPAYNEQQSIGKLLKRLSVIEHSDFEVVIVDDGSSDGTADVVRNFIQSRPNMRLIQQPINQGKTAAIARAIDESTGDVLIVQDADLEYDPAEIAEVINPIIKGQADVVYGSRFMVKKAARVLYFYHYLANKLLTLLSNLLTNRNMSDIETCYKAFRAEVIRPLRLTSCGFGMEIEITAMICKTKARTYEVPISYYGRTYEEGKKIGYRDGVAALWYIFYFNLIYPWTKTCRDYVTTVNASLAEIRRISDRNSSSDEHS
ncbi:MAG: glycosyltransferase family 2 protein [Pirellulaceae bacterium]|nr:glycosyltransferase family 2 protein [Pirellulaceae bacterium]